MFLMVGNPVSHGELVDLNQHTVDLAELAGFSHIETAIREGQNRRGNKMGQEFTPDIILGLLISQQVGSEWNLIPPSVGT